MAFLVFLVPILLGATLLMVKMMNQNSKDHNRITYRLSFPDPLDSDRVTEWIRSISGTLKRGPSRLGGTPTVVFEMWSTNKGIAHRMKVPWAHADYIVSQLRSLVPGIGVDDETEFEQRVWVKAMEVGLSHTSRQLRIYSPTATAASLLASVQTLNEDEAVVMQWVISPASPRHPPIHHETQSDHITYRTVLNGNQASHDEVADRRKKLEEPNLMAVLRIGAVAKTTVRADHLIFRVKASLASTRSASVRFTKRIVTKKDLQKRIDQAAAPVMYPMQLSAPELCALVAWPIGNPFVSGLPAPLARQLPVNEMVPRTGRIIGRSSFPGAERQVAIAFQDALKHVHVIGPTGVGKTALLANMMKQDIEAGYGVVLIENKGDLYRAALDYIPPERMDDVILLDATDRNFPVGFNVLTQGDSRVVIDELGALFDYLYRDTRSVWTREVLYFGLRTVAATPGLSFVDLPALLQPRTHEEVVWADDMRRNVKDVDVKRFWQRVENQNKAAQDRFVQPVLDRIWQLNGRPEIRNIIGQTDSSFQMTDVVQNNKILLVNLENVPKDAASLMGTLIMNALWHAVKLARSEKPTFLYLDEFQDFLNLPVDPQDMLAKARSLGLGMTLAHQHLGQLPPDMREAILANARTKIVFQTSGTDARTMVREYGTHVTDKDFMNLGRFEALARIATGDGVSAPLTLRTHPPAAGTGKKGEVVQMSRYKYGRPLEDVLKKMDERYGGHKVQNKRPDIGKSSKGGFGETNQ